MTTISNEIWQTEVPERIAMESEARTHDEIQLWSKILSEQTAKGYIFNLRAIVECELIPRVIKAEQHVRDRR